MNAHVNVDTGTKKKSILGIHTSCIDLRLHGKRFSEARSLIERYSKNDEPIRIIPVNTPGAYVTPPILQAISNMLEFYVKNPGRLPSKISIVVTAHPDCAMQKIPGICEEFLTTYSKYPGFNFNAFEALKEKYKLEIGIPDLNKHVENQIQLIEKMINKFESSKLNIKISGGTINHRTNKYIHILGDEGNFVKQICDLSRLDIEHIGHLDASIKFSSSIKPRAIIIRTSDARGARIQLAEDLKCSPNEIFDFRLPYLAKQQTEMLIETLGLFHILNTYEELWKGIYIATPSEHSKLYNFITKQMLRDPWMGLLFSERGFEYSKFSRGKGYTEIDYAHLNLSKRSQNY